MRTWLAVLLIAACGGRPRPAVGQPSADGACPAREVTFPSADGLVVHGTLAECGEGAPLVVLAHQMCRDRAEWSDAKHDWTGKLHARGISTLAIDLRGHGASKAWPDGATHDLCQELQDEAVAGLYAAMADDVIAAVRWARAAAAPRAMAVVGASIGANSALVAYDAEADLRLVIALSPGADYRGIQPAEAVSRYGARAALLLAARDDARSAAAVEELMKGSGAVTGRIFDEGGHGNDILAAHPAELDALVQALDGALR